MIALLISPPHRPHTVLVLYTTVLGLLMVAAGILRLRAPRSLRDQRFQRSSIVGTYGLMIALGAMLAGLALWWRVTA